MDIQFARSLVASYGSPLYVYDLEIVQRRAEELYALLPPEAILFYSLKANPLPAIGRVLRQLGCRAEISSSGELAAALAAGFSPEQILYTGPGKTLSEIQEALAAGVVHFSCESWNDLARLEQAAKEFKITVQVILRLNPTEGIPAQLSMTGVSSQFGFEPDQLLAERVRLRASSTWVRIIGLHFYYGTQITEGTVLLAAMQSTLEIAEKLSADLSLSFQILDLGGGFPWPYATTGESHELTALRSAWMELTSHQQRTAGAQLWFESGRYLCASAGTLLTTVMDVKEAREGKKYVILDTGINHLGGMSGLGRIPRSKISLQPMTLAPSPRREIVDVVGPLCSPLDYLARNLDIPSLQPGDLVGIPNTGAYGLTASLMNFLSRPAPVEVVYQGQTWIQAYQLRTRYEALPQSVLPEQRA